MNRKAAALLLSFAGAGFCLAQESVPPPKDPILPRLPSRADWTIVYRYDRDIAKDEILHPEQGKKTEEKPAGDKSVQAVPKETRISKDGNTYREVTTWRDGYQSEKWIIDGLQVRSTAAGNVVRIMLPTTYYASDYSDYARSDFEDVEWVDKKNYVGPGELNEAVAYVFKVAGDKKTRTPRENAERLADPAAANAKAEAAREYVAYLDVKNQLPVFLDDGDVIRTYTYTLNPADKLVPPQKFSQAIDDWKKRIKRKTAVPGAP